MHWSKTHEIKSKYKFNFFFIFEIISIDNRSCRKLFFFFPFLTYFLVTAIYRRFSTVPAQARKQSARAKTCFSFKIKDRIILFQLAGILKNNLRLFKLDSKYLLVRHNVVTSTKWRNVKTTPTLILLEDISVKIIGRGILQSYLWLAT